MGPFLHVYSGTRLLMVVMEVGPLRAVEPYGKKIRGWCVHVAISPALLC